MSLSRLTEELMDDFERKTEEMIIVKLRAVKGLVEDKELQEILNGYEFFALNFSDELEVIKSLMNELRTKGYELELVKPEPVFNYDKENFKISATSSAPKIKITKTIIEL